MDIKGNLQKIKDTLPVGVQLVLVTKTQSRDTIMEAYDTGHRIFGENKAQELVEKQPLLPPDIEWHFIGHLQRNKVKYIAPYVKMIHSVDSLRLLKEINKQALKNDRVIDCLLEFHIAEEDSKFGLSYEEACHILEDSTFSSLKNIRICGVMGMATFTDNSVQVCNEFKALGRLFEKIKAAYFIESPYFKEISMGMTNDYLMAIDEGSTMVRIGSAVFQ